MNESAAGSSSRMADCHFPTVTNDNASSSFFNVESSMAITDTRTNSTALTTVSEVTAITTATTNGGEVLSQCTTPLMTTPRSPFQKSRAASKGANSINSNGSSFLHVPTALNGHTSQRGMAHRTSSRRRGLHSPEERMLVVVLIAIVVLFVICTTPAAILSILYMNDSSYFTKSLGYAIFRAMANNFELLGFALNFFVYCLCSADIRRAFVDVLFENCVVQFIRTHANMATLMGNVAAMRRASSPRGSNASYEIAVQVPADPMASAAEDISKNINNGKAMHHHGAKEEESHYHAAESSHHAIEQNIAGMWQYSQSL